MGTDADDLGDDRHRGGSGEGQLTLQNLGPNCIYPFKVSGFGAGIQVGISRASAAGPVSNMTRLEDFPGSYGATHGEATILGGGGSTELKNKANNVTMALTSQTQGLNIGIAGGGVTVSMPVSRQRLRALWCSSSGTTRTAKQGQQSPDR